MLLIMTRWHEDDLAGRLLKQQEKTNKGPSDKNYWHLISFPALAEEDDPLGRNPGEPLWPARYDLEDLEDIQNEMTGELGSYWFTALFQQRPAPEEGGLFKAEWFRLYSIKDDHIVYGPHYGESLPISALDVFTVSDTALTTKDHSDFTVVSTWGVHRDRQLLILLDLKRGRLEGPDIIPLIRKQGAQHNARVHWIEKSTASLTLIQHGRRDGLPIRELVADRDKHSRALAATPHFEAGHVLFPLHAPFMPKFLEELLQFPNAKHDDQVDVVSYAAGVCFPQYARSSRAPSLTRRPRSSPPGFGINAPQRLTG
jgi:predicted phage terminase large subunit-like protein